MEGVVRHPGLDGLRGIAIAAVVVFHGGVGLPGGALGVDLFLVLSGFLITGILLRELEGSGRIDLRGFWGRRLRRLLPALLVVVTAVAVHGAVAGDVDPGMLRADALSTLTYVANWRFVVADGGYFASFGAPSPLRHAWSLAVEEQWYLLWPPALWGLWRLLGRRPAALTGALLALAVGSAGLMARWAEDLDRVHYGTDTRAQGLLVGAALAVLVHHRPIASWDERARRWLRSATVPALAAVGIAFVVGRGTEAWLYRGGHLAFAVVAAVALAGSLLPGAARSVLSLRPLRWLGEISYGLYLWHWPAFVALTPERVDVGRWPLFAVRVAVSLGLAVASARWVERPFRRQAPRRAARLARPGLAAITATATVAVLVVGAAAAGREPSADTAFADAPVLPAGFDVEAAAAPPPVPATEPVTTGSTSAPAPPPLVPLPPPAAGAPDGELVVTVVGDSTGWTLAWEVRDPPGVDIRDGAVIGCGLDPADIVVDGVATPIYGQPVDCPSAPALWEHFVLHPQPDVVLLTVGAWEVFDRQLPDGTRLEVGTPEWHAWTTTGLDGVAGRLAAAAPGALLVIPTVPCFDERVDWLGGPASARNDPERVAAVNAVVADYVAANRDRVATVPMADWLCPDGEPRPELDGVQLRVDGVHVAEPDAQQAVWRRLLLPALAAMVPTP